MNLSYDQRVADAQRLTLASHRSPRLYRFRVIAWIVLGYLLVAALAITALLLAGGVIWIVIAAHIWILLKFAWIPLVFAWLLVRALFVTIEEPTGRMMQAHEAPRLFSTIEDIRKRLGVGRLSAVMLVSEMNAAVVETPRFGGILGWKRTLIVGLPLLLVHSTAELKAILAHEMGHLSGRHGRLSAWSYRVRLTWTRVVESLAAHHDRTSRLLSRLFEWYVSSLLAVTIVQARAQEYAADRLSAEITDRVTAARALAWTAVAHKLIDDRVWEPLWKRTAIEPAPTVSPMSDLLRRRDEILAPPYDDLLNNELRRLTATDDTHPALRERLAALGNARPAIGLSVGTAAEELLGKSVAALVGECDLAWRKMVMPLWQNRHEEQRRSEEALAMPVDADATALTDEQLQDRADALAKLGKDAEAFALYETVAQRKPHDPRAAFCYGRALLLRGELKGLDHLQRAADRDWRFTLPVCELAYTTLRERGLERDADVWARRHREHQKRIAEAQVDARTLRSNDDLAPSALPARLQESIVTRCREAGWVGKVWIAKKQLQSLPESVELLAVRAKMFSHASPKKVSALAETLGECEVILFVVSSGALMRRLDRVPGARVI